MPRSNVQPTAGGHIPQNIKVKDFLYHWFDFVILIAYVSYKQGRKILANNYYALTLLFSHIKHTQKNT